MPITVSDYLSRTKVACLSYRLPPEIDEQALDRLDQLQLQQLLTLVDADLLVLDDLFLARRIGDEAGELLQTQGHQSYKLKRSIVAPPNRVVQGWGKYLGANTMATTFLEMLMHRADILEFDGKSYRLKEAA